MEQKKSVEEQKLWNLLEREWNYTLETVPEFATIFGEHSYDGKLSDLSVESFEDRKQHLKDLLKELDLFDLTKLNEENKLNFHLFYDKTQNELKELNFNGHYLTINQMEGVQNDFSHIVMMMPNKKEVDFENYLSRLKAFPKYIDQIIDLLEKGLSEGYSLPKPAVSNVPDQIMGQIPKDYKTSVYYKFIEKENKYLSKDLKEEIEDAIQNKLYLGFRILNNYMVEKYIPACRDTYGLYDLPNGEEYYAHKLKTMTTTDLSAKEIHEIGLSEVERIFKEFHGIAHELGFKDYDKFLEYLKTNPDFYFTDPNLLMMTYRDISKRADKELPAFFKTLPRLPYGVEEIPAHQAPSYPTAYYMPADVNMTRAGLFFANTFRLDIRPKYEMEALTLHEAVPGHHLQISLSYELDNLPKFRRLAMSDFTGYIEGWGLYSEKLGEEMGFYKDPYSKFGQLSFEIWRACRLVIDTGLHAFKWSREKSIEFLQKYTGKSEAACAVEVDRYMSIPGQATAYKIGELKILELRKKFENARGEDFDIREFHDVILRNGALPLNILEQYVNEHLNS